jgi:Calcineurin-like phosphoesterase
VDGFQKKLFDHNMRQGAECEGEVGVNQVCTYKGLTLVLSGVGTLGSRSEDFLDQSLRQYGGRWRVCVWHQNQNLFQLGSKQDATGWRAYETCREHGAIIQTGHEHSYARSFTLSNMEQQTLVSPDKDNVHVRANESFVIVSSVAGQSVRKCENNYEDHYWWADAECADTGLEPGALICKYNYNGQADKAYCYFVQHDGVVRDSFFVTTHMPPNRHCGPDSLCQVGRASACECFYGQDGMGGCRNRFVEPKPTSCSTPPPEPSPVVCNGDAPKCFEKTKQLRGPNPTEYMIPSLTIAHLGDQGLGSAARTVLRRLRDEGVHAVVHAGDFSYECDGEAWMSMIESELGTSFPYFAAVGNRDVDDPQSAIPQCRDQFSNPTSGYQRKIFDHNMAQGAECVGEVGVNQVCTFRGLTLVLSGVGTLGSRHEDFIAQSFRKYGGRWRVCAWHQNQNLFQLGSKQDKVGWRAYETCKEHGAIIQTGHEHSYARTFTLSDMETQDVLNTNNDLVVGANRSFVLVSSVGGKSVRDCENNYDKHKWWADAECNQTGLEPGALICKYNYNGQADKAFCYFMQHDGVVRDSFYVTSHNPPFGGCEPDASCSSTSECVCDFGWAGEEPGSGCSHSPPNVPSTPPTKETVAASTGESRGLGGGAIAAIIIAFLLVACGALGLAITTFRRKRREAVDKFAQGRRAALEKDDDESSMEIGDELSSSESSLSL